MLKLVHGNIFFTFPRHIHVTDASGLALTERSTGIIGVSIMMLQVFGKDAVMISLYCVKIHLQLNEQHPVSKNEKYT